MGLRDAYPQGCRRHPERRPQRACDVAALAAALGHHPNVRVLPQDRIYRKAIDAVAFYHDLVTTTTAACTHRVRVLGEVGFGTSPGDAAEWLRFEAVCNHALAPLPMWSVCAYNTPALPPSFVDTALATHPWLRTTDGTAANPDYIPPARLLQDAGPPLTPPQDAAVTVHLTHGGDLRGLRHWLRARLQHTVTNPDALEAVVIAVHEVAGNGLQHGRPPVRVTLWLTTTQIICDVNDRGPGTSDPLAGYTPPDPADPAEHGAGLWLTRRLCDEVTTARTRTGFTVRLALNHGHPQPPTPDAPDRQTTDAPRRSHL